MNLLLKTVLFIVLTQGVAQAADSKVSIQEISRTYLESQRAFSDARDTKSIERLLRLLEKADVSIQLAREKIRVHESANQAEQRMKNRLTQKLLEDAEFLRNLKADLGLAESDSIESYRNLRHSLLQDPDQKRYVIKMDLQILITMEQKSLTKSRITTR